MRKIFTLFILLLLLPVTALAAEGAPGSLYVAGQQITDEGYYTQSGGNWTKSGDASTPPSAPYFHYTKGNDNTPATLTLSGATIQGGTSTGTVPYGAGIYAQCKDSESVSLTIELIGNNTITGYYGIYVNAEISENSNGTDASLTITGENNVSLEVSGSFYGIFVKSGKGNASVTIENASVDAKTTQTNSGYAGVCVQSGASSKDSPNLSLAVNGGSLTTSGSASGDGIQFVVGAHVATRATTSLTVTDNAIVDARNGGISASRTSVTLPTPTPSGENSSGIVFDGNSGTVYGDVTLDESLTINQGETLTTPEGSSLNGNGKLTNNGTIIVKEGGKLEGEPGGTVVSAPTIGTQPADKSVTEGETATFTVNATGSDLSYQWQQNTNGSAWTDITGETNATYTIATTTMNINGTQYRCVVSNSAGSVTSNAATLTVNAKPTYTITAVSSPAEGGTATTDKTTAAAGETITLIATPSSGYYFVEWKVVSGTVSIQNNKFTMPAENVEVQAVFGLSVTSITLDKTELSLYTGDSETLTATIEPDNATNQNVTWSSSDETIATVDNNGTVTAVGAGEATITVTTENGCKTATCIVTVTVPVTGVTLEPTSLSLFTGDTAPLTATVQPSDATNQNVTWSSDKPEVATVDNGKVTAVGAGEATITATAGGITATCVVHVRKPATVEPSGSTNLSFTTDRDEFSLTATVHAQGNDLNPKDGSWTWAVADEDVVALSGSPTLLRAFVSSSRQAFTVEGTGTTTITATYDDGTYRGLVEFKVSISKPTPPDPISYYNIYVEDVCDGVEVTLSNNVVREGNSISVYVKKDTVNYTFDNFKVYYKRSYYGGWEELKEGTQPGEYPIKNIWTHIYIKAEGAEEKEDPTGIESIEGVKVYTKDGSLYVQTPQREQVIIVSMSGAVVKNEEQIGLKQYHGLQSGIYIVRVGDRAYKLRLN